ncbi:hypothetical protein QO004_000077 [Rhizobium mesoamericanum]|uniref:hypothetical protein n=1 Tax=Rhizobium mesoamericanum TaxID=1079800 RepID=UPI00278861D4|nr:hypothetical protein [Rhizobium mesoamericanum]MDQ0558304.1 hypothetical protein [Rhizobium mesoamericanum]
MTITFPRELPDVGYVAADFLLDDSVKASASGGRLINYTQVEDPAWVANLTTRPLTYNQYAAVEAWWLSLREGLRSVLFRHPLVCYPAAHGKNQTPADDAGNLISVTDGNILAVNGIDAGLSLAVGDRIGLERSSKYYVGRITEVTGSGVTRTITVEPTPFDTVAQAGAVVRFAKPALVMRPVPGSFQAPRSGRFYSVSFQLRESQ